MRMLGSSGGERRNAFAALEREMQEAGIGWTDLGNMIEGAGGYSEAELEEYGAEKRKEGVEAGIRVGMARKAMNGGKSNGGYSLPNSSEMAEFCHDRVGQLSSDWQRDFIADIFSITRSGVRRLSTRRLANLAKIYIEIGGTI